MAIYIVRRLLSSSVSFIVVSFLVFLLMHAIPGGPFENVQRGLSPTAEANMLRLYGLNHPLMTQYFNYMNGLIHLNLGVAWESPGEPMLQLIGSSLAISASVAVIGLAYGVIGGVVLGVLAAQYRSRALDLIINLFSTVLLTTPTFVIAIFLVSIFAVSLRWFPAGGWGGIQYMILPAIAYGVNPLGTVARYTRNSVVEEVDHLYVRVAHSKGLSPTVVMTRHVLKNSIVPIITIVAPMIPGLLTGSVFIEAIFNVPGLGGYFVSAITNRDYPLEMTLILFVTMLMVLAILAAVLISLILYRRIVTYKPGY